MIGVTAVILLLVQVAICYNCRTLSWQAVLPILLGLTTAGMWISFFLKPKFTSYILGLICLVWMAAVLLGWGIMTVVKKRQNKEK